MIKNLAIIPARGGSKRIPKKNIIDFHGKPMISWTIIAALESNKFDKVVVSTDCEEIAETSLKFGASVPFLRLADFDDITPASEATINYTTELENFYGDSILTITQLMANCPLRTSKDIIDFLEEYQRMNIDFLLSSFKFGWMNPWWSFKLNANQEHSFLFPKSLTQRSQDLESLYCPTGSIWVANFDKLKANGSFYGDNQRFKEIPWKSAVDIDDEDDLEFARAVAIYARL
tara:strand:- start:1910 stop:2605 length:696 start_codon:yes stop_codon:yes gene_type:complete